MRQNPVRFARCFFSSADAQDGIIRQRGRNVFPLVLQFFRGIYIIGLLPVARPDKIYQTTAGKAKPPGGMKKKKRDALSK
ncbi:hypothetical protein HMPREF9141_0918 [Prevotella multiformis DSM 16608]|jgi:hypothetical protein|uniref:Uncharacterized protein n=1 Tax=Prevotella multiformis DSM 16608 TaxID=888743 RepID=F0F5Q2_9BACT|nr:hypothetical protein HMPREF9141_0918 [Prevotella multiformis DSM 16608]